MWAKRDDKPTFFLSAAFRTAMPGSFECEAAAIGNACFVLMKAGYIGGDHHVLIKTDCMAVIDAVGRFVHKPSERIDPFIAPLRKAKDAVRCLEIRHVKGHNNDGSPRTAVNARCDREARRRMEEIRKTMS